jgi:hypothetical protein
MAALNTMLALKINYIKYVKYEMIIKIVRIIIMHLHLGVALAHHVEEEGVSIIVQRLRRNQTQSSKEPSR